MCTGSRRYIRHHGIRHPNTMGRVEVEQFLTHLAVEGRVAASTQNQALGALLFLYKEVLAAGAGRGWTRCGRGGRSGCRVVLTRARCGNCWRPSTAAEREPMADGELLYGAGLRLLRVLRLRVKDVDLERGR